MVVGGLGAKGKTTVISGLRLGSGEISVRAGASHLLTSFVNLCSNSQPFRFLLSKDLQFSVYSCSGDYECRLVLSSFVSCKICEVCSQTAC